MEPKESNLNPNAAPFVPPNRRHGEPGPPHLKGFEKPLNQYDPYVSPCNSYAGPSQKVNEAAGFDDHFHFDMDLDMDMEYLKMLFLPDFSEKCIAEVYQLNMGDLEDTIYMLNHLAVSETPPSTSTDLFVDDSESSTQAQSSTLKPEDFPGTGEGSDY